MTLSIQMPHQLHCPPLGMPQHLSVCLELRAPELDTCFNVWPHSRTGRQSLCRASLPSSRSTIPPNSGLSANSLRMSLIPLSRSWMKTLNITRPNSTGSLGEPLLTSCQLDKQHSLPPSGHGHPALTQLRVHLLPLSPGECHGWQFPRLYWTHHKVCLVSKYPGNIQYLNQCAVGAWAEHSGKPQHSVVNTLNVSLFVETNLGEPLIRMASKTEFLSSFFYSPKFRSHILGTNLE